MAETVEVINKRIEGVLTSLKADGIINDQFSFVHDMDNPQKPVFVVDLITTFLVSSQDTLAKMINVLNQPDLDYNKLSELCIKMKGSSSSIGAHRLGKAVYKLYNATVTDRLPKKKCMKAVDHIKLEYGNFEGAITELVKLEKILIEGPHQNSSSQKAALQEEAQGL